MAYDMQIWKDFPSGGTPISAARLNHMEQGIASAGSTAAADAAQATANSALSKATTALTTANNAQSDVNSLSAVFSPTTGGFTAASGWTINRGDIIKVGRLAACDVSLVRTGATITVSASGNLTNQAVGTVSSAFTNWGLVAPLSGGAGGALSDFYLQGTTIYLAAYAPGVDIATNDTITFGGTWITAS